MAALIFTGPLAPFRLAGLGMILLGGLAVRLVTAALIVEAGFLPGLAFGLAAGAGGSRRWWPRRAAPPRGGWRSPRPDERGAAARSARRGAGGQAAVRCYTPTPWIPAM